MSERGADEGIPANKRKTGRQPVLRTARVMLSASVVDCLVLDLSDDGIRLGTETFTPFPEDVVVELRSGGRWAAKLRWQRGTESGFEFTTFAGLSDQAAGEVSTLYDTLCHAGVRPVIDRLAEARYFDHAGLEQAAKAMHVAVRNLEEALKKAGRRG